MTAENDIRDIMKPSNNLFNKDARSLTCEGLMEIIQLVSCDIRRNGIPARAELASSTGDFEEVLRDSPELENWLHDLRREIDLHISADNEWYPAVSCITGFIEKKCHCKITLALYNGAGSFTVSLGTWLVREREAYILMAQAALLARFDVDRLHNSSKTKDLYQIARQIVKNDGDFLFLPLYSNTSGHVSDELFHGVLIAEFNHDELRGHPDTGRLEFFAHYLGQEMGRRRANHYLPTIQKGSFQQHIQRDILDQPPDVIRGLFNEGRVTKPSAGLSPWIMAGRRKGESLPDYRDNEFRTAMGSNIDECQRQLERLGRDKLLILMSEALNDLFAAEHCLYLEYDGHSKYKLVGKAPAIVDYCNCENVAAISAMIGAPYQTQAGRCVVIAIPQYAAGGYVGTSVIIKNEDIPPPIKPTWQMILWFCYHMFNALYKSDQDVPDNKYSCESPWDGFIDVLPSNFGRDGIEIVRTFPPSLSRKPEDTAKFGGDELDKISSWLLRCMRQIGPNPGCMMTATGELAGVVGEKEAVQFYQSSTTTIADLCSRARLDPWPTTMRAIFRDAHRFFGDEDVDPMLLAIHRGGGHFNIYHSGEGDLDQSDEKICEIIAKLVAIRGHRFFISSDDPEPLHELLRSRVGNYSFAVLPLYAEEELNEEGLQNWQKKYGGFIGSFTTTLSSKRGRPSNEEWLKWCMFVPRIFQIMKAARDAGRLEFCDIRDIAPSRHEGKFIQSFRIWR